MTDNECDAERLAAERKWAQRWVDTGIYNPDYEKTEIPAEGAHSDARD